ncbi:hypothetical protein HPP92_028003 [Vanilla planifolia]|uniref:Uncharacterized protein n=1 Tax=Vanilla planifolia TaxID=51239 RepID=A0A835U4J8_VANPL|nr:hypothetical protein HPP92_028003 [Vanilla planifolia]
MAESDTKEEEEGREKEGVTAVYRLNVHCNECADAVEKPIIRTSEYARTVEEELINYMHKKARKRAEIVSEKQEKKSI